MAVHKICGIRALNHVVGVDSRENGIVDRVIEDFVRRTGLILTSIKAILESMLPGQRPDPANELTWPFIGVVSGYNIVAIRAVSRSHRTSVWRYLNRDVPELACGGGGGVYNTLLVTYL